MQLSLCLPAQGQRMSSPRRIIGDPGYTEIFDLPKYAYIIVMKDNGDDTWSVWKREKRVLAADDWKKKRYYGSNATYRDSIFMYNKPIHFLLQKQNLRGRVYAICSNKDLKFNKSIDAITDLDDLLEWTFDCSQDSIQKNVQNIYSTPYNYEVNGDYYCSFDCTSGHTYIVDLLLYHVATKVDITWSVKKDVRINKENPEKAVRLTYMEARRLFDGNAYCFKPMRNELPSKIGDGEGYAITDIVTPGVEGQWWEGRAYFYTIPYIVTGREDYYPLQMQLCTNGTDKSNAYCPTFELKIDTSSVFVPWLRANVKISQPLEDKADKNEVIEVND